MIKQITSIYVKKWHLYFAALVIIGAIRGSCKEGLYEELGIEDLKY